MSEFKLSHLSHNELEDLLGEKANEYEKLSLDAAKAKADYEQLSAFTKTVWAQNYPPKTTGAPVADREAEAHQSQLYVDHLTAMSDAYRAKELAVAKARACEVKYETIKSALLKRYGHS